MSFFGSRWVERPAHVREASRAARGLPRRRGVAPGSSPAASPTSALLVSDAAETTSAARFTRSGVLAAPVLTCMERCDLGALRAVAANAGNANAATGRPGLDAAAKMQGAGAMAGGRVRDRRSRSPRPA